MHKQIRPEKPELPDCKNFNTFKNAVKPYLLQMSDNHCSYCDEYVLNSGNFVVEHYQNKDDFPELKCEWENLFIACFSCNNHKKDKQYSENPKPIKPDESDYSFGKYFHFDANIGKILPKNNDRATKTINFLNLNNEDLLQARITFMNKLTENENFVFCNSFRFILDNLL